MTPGYRDGVTRDATHRSTAGALLARVRAEVEGLVGMPLPNQDKRALLACLPRIEDAFAVGRSIRGWGANPVFRAVVGAPTPQAVLQRWQSIEAFGHPSHRTRIVEADAASLLLEHVCLEGKPIAVVEDVFVWGLVVGLLELWGAQDVAVELPSGPIEDGIEGPTTRVRVRTQPRVEPPALAWTAGTSWASAVTVVFGTDLLRPWTVADVARRLRRSPRSLQRYLRREDATFSTLLQRARVDAAVVLLETTELGLSEVAFCTGFSDHAHLSRTTRKFTDAPPSTLRTLLRRIGDHE